MAAPGVLELVSKGKQAPVPCENMSREEPLPVDTASSKGDSSGQTDTANGEASPGNNGTEEDMETMINTPDSNHAIMVPETISQNGTHIEDMNLNKKLMIAESPPSTVPILVESDSDKTRDSVISEESTPSVDLALPHIPILLNDTDEKETTIIKTDSGMTIEVQHRPPYKGVMVPCASLKNYLDSLTTFNRKCMLRKGREVHKIYVDLTKGETFLDDQFAYTEFGRMVLTNGSIRAGRAKNAKQIVVARETLYCSGTTACKRACGGMGVCIPGCDKTKMRGHRCSYRIKLTQRLGFVNHWFVEELGDHAQYGKENEKNVDKNSAIDLTKASKKVSPSRQKREIRPMPNHLNSHSKLTNGNIGSVSEKFNVNSNEVNHNYHYILGLMPTGSPSYDSPAGTSPRSEQEPDSISSPASSVLPPGVDMSRADLANQAALSLAIANNTMSAMMPSLPLNIVSYIPEGINLEMLQSQAAAFNPLLVNVKQEHSEEGLGSPALYAGLSSGQMPTFSPNHISKSHSPSPSHSHGSKERSPIGLSQLSSQINAKELEMKLKAEHSQKMQAHHETLGQVHNRIMERARMRKSAQTVRVPQKTQSANGDSSQNLSMNLNIPNTLSSHSSGDNKPMSETLLNRFQTLNQILQSKAFQEAKSQLESKKPRTQNGDHGQETALNLTVKNEKLDTIDRKLSPYYKLAEEWKKGEQLHNSVSSVLTNGIKDEVAMETDCGELTDNEKELMCRVRQLESHVKQLQNIVIKRERDGSEDRTGSSRRKKSQRDFDFTKYNTRHVALKIVYLGFDYQGFASQEETDNTIEAVIFEALKKTRLIESRETSCYHRCGRTDRGVSAFSQVISIDLRSNLLNGDGVKVREEGTAAERPGDKTTEIRYCHILNKVLPPEIRVLAWAPVDPEFSARFSCKKRTYKYIFPKGNTDIDAMNEAAQKLVGEHDYRNLCKMDVANGVTNFTRKIYSADIVPLEDGDSGYTMYELTIIGSSFLWHQIRCIVTVLILVGQQKEKPEIVDELLDVTKNPCKPQYTMASELPLCLYDTEFGDDFDWIYEADWHEDNIKTLQELWGHHAVKASMIKSMLNDLDKAKVETECDIAPWSDLSAPVYGQMEWIVPRSKARVYKPLMERPTCDSLEDRMEHFAKKRKLNSGEEEPAQSETVDG